jgi:hypothetical protein
MAVREIVMRWWGSGPESVRGINNEQSLNGQSRVVVKLELSLGGALLTHRHVVVLDRTKALQQLGGYQEVLRLWWS